MKYEDFKLNKIVFEVRFREAFLYWDNCGKTFKEIQKVFPELIRKSVTNEESTLIDEKKNLELSFNYRHIIYAQNNTDSLNYFREVVEGTLTKITKNFEIQEFTRIGNRYQYVLPLKSASDYNVNTGKSGLFSVLEAKKGIFGDAFVEGSMVGMFNDNINNYRIEIVRVARNEAIKNKSVLNEEYAPKDGLRFDIDIVTTKPMKVDIIDPKKIIHDNSKKIEAGISRFMGE